MLVKIVSPLGIAIVSGRVGEIHVVAFMSLTKENVSRKAVAIFNQK